MTRSVCERAWEAYCAEDADRGNVHEHRAFDAGFAAAVDWTRQSLEAMADLRCTTPHTIARALLEELDA
jgi:hypothetical protein